MELKIDLYKEKKKSLFRVGLGILFFSTAITGIIVNYNKETLIPLMWFVYVILALSGIVQFVGGLGYPIDSLFGKAYIWINDEFISLKPSALRKEHLIKWNEIQTVDYKLNKFIIQKTDKTTVIIDLSKFEYMVSMKIKEVICDIGKQKMLICE